MKANIRLHFQRKFCFNPRILFWQQAVVLEGSSAPHDAPIAPSVLPSSTIAPRLLYEDASETLAVDQLPRLRLTSFLCARDTVRVFIGHVHSAGFSWRAWGCSSCLFSKWLLSRTTTIDHICFLGVYSSNPRGAKPSISIISPLLSAVDALA